MVIHVDLTVYREVRYATDLDVNSRQQALRRVATLSSQRISRRRLRRCWRAPGGRRLDGDGYVITLGLTRGVCHRVTDMIGAAVALLALIEHDQSRRLESRTAGNLVGTQHGLTDSQHTI